MGPINFTGVFCIFLVCLLLSTVTASDAKQWQGTVSIVFSGKSLDRTISATATSKVSTISVDQKAQAVSGSIPLETSTIRMVSVRDKVFEKLVQKKLKTVIIDHSALLFSDAGLNEGKPTMLPLYISINQQKQPISVAVKKWSQTDKVTECEADFTLSLKKAGIEISRVLPLDDTVSVTVKLAFKPPASKGE